MCRGLFLLLGRTLEEEDLGNFHRTIVLNQLNVCEWGSEDQIPTS